MIRFASTGRMSGIAPRHHPAYYVSDGLRSLGIVAHYPTGWFARVDVGPVLGPFRTRRAAAEALR